LSDHLRDRVEGALGKSYDFNENCVGLLVSVSEERTIDFGHINRRNFLGERLI